MNLPEFKGLIKSEGESGVVRYALRSGEHVAVFPGQIGLYRSGEDGIGRLHMTIRHDGSAEGIESVIRIALDYRGE